MARESSAQQIRVTGSSISAASVKDYQALQEFVVKVSESCSMVEDGSGQQTLSVISFLERIRDKTWADIKSALSK